MIEFTDEEDFKICSSGDMYFGLEHCQKPIQWSQGIWECRVCNKIPSKLTFKKYYFLFRLHPGFAKEKHIIAARWFLNET